MDPLLQPRDLYSTCFLITKKDGGFCSILDLWDLNRYLKVFLFHMLTMAEMISRVQPGDWFTSINLKDDYFHLPIAAHHQPFLRFAVQGRHYQFTVLPFGLFLSPRLSTRCVAAALLPVQAEGARVLP